MFHKLSTKVGFGQNWQRKKTGLDMSNNLDIIKDYSDAESDEFEPVLVDGAWSIVRKGKANTMEQRFEEEHGSSLAPNAQPSLVSQNSPGMSSHR